MLPQQLPVSMSSLARVAATALTKASARPPASLGLILSNDQELARLNAQHMGEIGATDVLSFPLLPPSAFPAHAGRSASHEERRPVEPPFDTPPRQRTNLGDIVISVERAMEQAPAMPAAELRQLVAHGVLHICGWDHALDEERDAMRALEREILNRL
jgi:probable rRNA maturation factor